MAIAAIAIASLGCGHPPSSIQLLRTPPKVGQVVRYVARQVISGSFGELVRETDTSESVIEVDATYYKKKFEVSETKLVLNGKPMPLHQATHTSKLSLKGDLLSTSADKSAFRLDHVFSPSALPKVLRTGQKWTTASEGAITRGVPAWFASYEVVGIVDGSDPYAIVKVHFEEKSGALPMKADGRLKVTSDNRKREIDYEVSNPPPVGIAGADHVSVHVQKVDRR